MKQVLVTGGCGFIGSNFIRQQLDDHADLEITNVDKLTYAGNPENLTGVDEARYTFEHADIGDRKRMDAILSQRSFDVVINFAAESHVDRSILDSSDFVQTNIVGTQVLLDACRAAEIPRYVQVSTDEVYGSLGATGLFTETTPLSPNSPYSASKAAADMLVMSYVHTFGFPAVITRCSNNYGPFQFPEKLIPLFISNALQDKPLPIYGQGTNVRDWIHVSDHCSGIAAAAERGRVGEVYNFGGDSELTNIQLTHQLLEVLDKPQTLITYVADRPGHDQRYAIDFTKAREELGWEPSTTFTQGLESTVAWYLENAAWIERVQSGAYRSYYETQYGARLQETS